MEKYVILDVLKKSIHNLLQSYECHKETVIEDSQITQSLCSSIEALFLHGALSTQTVGILSKLGRTKQPYEYNFRNFLVEFIPRSLVKSLEHYNFKLTSVGFGRVWLRCTLNESTILSYLQSMTKDDQRLKRFYCQESLIRDGELMCAFCGLLQSIEHLVFNLDTSLPVLNTWINSDALQISGLQHHVSSKADANNDALYSEMSITDDKTLSLITSNEEEIMPVRLYNSASVPTNRFFEPHSPVPNNPIGDFNDEVNSESDTPDDLNQLNDEIDEVHIKPHQDIIKGFADDIDTTEPLINSAENESKDTVGVPDLISTEQCALDELQHEHINTRENDEYHSDNLELVDEIAERYSDTINQYSGCIDMANNEPQGSFDQLWAQCNLDLSVPIDEIHISNNYHSSELSPEIILEPSETSESSNIESPKVYSSLFLSRMIASTADFLNYVSKGRFPFRFFKVKETEQSWVFIGDELLTRNAELKKLMEIFPGVTDASAKSGENSVFGGLCHKCHKSLETNRVFLDYYDGKLYCFNCESKVKAVIPRDVISNWDFTPKAVSETTKRFLSEIMVHPNINLVTNSCLFDVVPELARVRKLRQKLSLLWLQVISCDIEMSTRVRQAMFPREYMLASVKEKDLYSLEDLIILQNGVLEKTLLHVIDKIAIPHVTKCVVCRMKALACDKCRDENNLIYIHEIDGYTECCTPLCQSVVHNYCKKSSTKSFYCRRCFQYLQNQQPITLASFDTADVN